MAEQVWEHQAFLDTTLVKITITTDDQDLERGQDVGVATHLAIKRLLVDLTMKDAANRVLGETFQSLRQRAER
jgi:hypothetical protein